MVTELSREERFVDRFVAVFSKMLCCSVSVKSETSMRSVGVSVSDPFTFTRHAIYRYESCPKQACDLCSQICKDSVSPLSSLVYLSV